MGLKYYQKNTLIRKTIVKIRPIMGLKLPFPEPINDSITLKSDL